MDIDSPLLLPPTQPEDPRPAIQAMVDKGIKDEVHRAIAQALLVKLQGEHAAAVQRHEVMVARYEKALKKYEEEFIVFIMLAMED